MSFHLLLKHYHNGDVDKFCALLASGANGQYPSRGFGGQGNGHMGGVVGSPSGCGTSTKHRKVSGQAANTGKGARIEVNGRDHAGLTILHRAVTENAIAFAMALIEHNATDLHIQDTENGWTALHRALYFGNITLAQAIIERDSSCIKVKDHEGNSPFDLYNATIARRTLHLENEHDFDEESQDENESLDEPGSGTVQSQLLDGDEVFAWGSSRNHGLGFKDQDDRKNPERINLTRPDHLLFRFYREYLEARGGSSESPSKRSSFPKSVSDLPTLISNRPIVIQDVALSKLHSAILTSDPESNLYMCGFGPGGRLGTGDETTRFGYIPVDEGSLSGKKVIKIALGQNHTLAVTEDGSLSSWGTNSFGQLGYTLPRPAMKDEEPVCTTPRQIFGTLKREVIIGVAASAIHSVAHTSTSLYTWGKNEGQLGLMDSDSRSLEVQTVPRKVAVSLFKAPIKMVSAINGATIILLANHSLFVFSNYGYNLVKFPQESFTNYHLKNAALTTRYDSMSIHITDITAGGDTIGAISSRGDLFTITLRKPDVSASASTTNPSKIKDSLSAPQRVWSLRKGNWDGVKSAGIAENGSVVVCTQAGAVWKRIERSNIKNISSGGRKDFKFQRVPGLSKVTAIRSTPFEVFTAIRKDCDVTRTQVLVQDQSLWKDLAPLLSISDLVASSPPEESEDESAEPRFWKPMMPVDLFEPLKRAVLTSPDLEADVSRLLLGQDFSGCNLEIGTTLSEVKIPVHGFMLGRSAVLRKAMDSFRSHGSASIPDVLDIMSGVTTSSQSLFGGESSTTTKPCLTFHGLDFIVLVNLLIYLYTDEVIDVWHFTRQAASMAFRYRQIRVEMMKLANHLNLDQLESSVRLMVQPEKQLNVHLSSALRDPSFTEDGDTIIELDGDEVMAYSSLLCQRCPFFEGLFNGRAGGQWLAGRRQNSSEPVRIDLKHMQPTAFGLVLRYLYADVGAEMFDEIVCSNIDEFSELVLEVMAAANELMLDRLSQICQQVLGRFVTTRNISGLLNTIAPCSEKAFKHAALEYICLQLESMLENHLMNDLDEDLLLELDDVVKANQLNCLPFAKSGRADLLLHEQHPDLAEDNHEEKQRRVRDVAFRANLHLKEEEQKLSNAFRARIGSVDDRTSTSPGHGHDKSRRKSQQARNAPFSPSLRPKDTSADLMFDMDEEDTSIVGSPDSPSLRALHVPRIRQESSSPAWESTEPRSMPDIEAASFPPITPSDTARPTDTPPSNKKWSSPALSSSKLDMREIMAQASATRTSALSMSISAQMAKDEAVRKQAAPKLSQKERKKQQQNILQQALSQAQSSPDPGDSKPSSPWQVAAGTKTSLKDVLEQPALPSPVQSAKTLAPPVVKSGTPRRTASPDTRFSGQIRSNSAQKIDKLASRPNTSATSKPSPSSPHNFPPISSRPKPPSSTSSPTPHQASTSSPIIPHSKSYKKDRGSRAEPTLLLSMEDIIGLQRREQELVAEAKAKRSLQEIQEEQAFQEWWDKEAARAREEEEGAIERAKVISSKTSNAKSGGGGGGARGKQNGAEGGKGENGRGDIGKAGRGGRGGRGRGGGEPSRGRGRGRGGGMVGNGTAQETRSA